MRIDLILGVFILLLASAAFLMAMKETRQTIDMARKGIEERFKDMKLPEQLVKVNCKQQPLPIPHVYVDYGLTRQLFDNRKTLEFQQMISGDEVEKTKQYDPLYPVDNNVMQTVGVDGAHGEFKFRASEQALQDTMRTLDSGLVEIGGPAPSELKSTLRQAPIIHTENAKDPEEEKAGVELEEYAKNPGQGLMEIGGAVVRLRDSKPFALRSGLPKDDAEMQPVKPLPGT